MQPQFCYKLSLAFQFIFQFLNVWLANYKALFIQFQRDKTIPNIAFVTLNQAFSFYTFYTPGVVFNASWSINGVPQSWLHCLLWMGPSSNSMFQEEEKVNMFFQFAKLHPILQIGCMAIIKSPPKYWFPSTVDETFSKNILQKIELTDEYFTIISCQSFSRVHWQIKLYFGICE